MIHRVEIRNFKALREVSLDLERLTVLVGPNASGKTSVLEAIRYLSESEPDAVKEGRLLPAPLRMWRTRETSGDVLLQCRGDAWTLRLVGTESGDAWSAHPNSTVPQRLGPSVLLQLDAERVRAPSYSDQPLPQVGPDGHGVASVLAYMALEDADGLEWLQESLRQVVPSFRAVRTPRAPVVRTESEVITIEGKPFMHRGERTYWGNSLEFDMLGAAGIPAFMVSEGTLLVLALLTVVIGPGHPRLLLIDDLDWALHPKAQADLIGLLRLTLEQHPELQIVATSHSPYLLDHLAPEEVWLTTLRDDGSVACGRLDEHPEFEKWRETMTPGEFWSHVGEKWLLDAKAGGQA